MNALAQSLKRIIKLAEDNKSSPQDFFRALKDLSAQVAVEGSRDADPNFTIGEMMPAFLRALPYKSLILKMNVDDWVAQGVTGRDLLINQLRSKQVTYRELSCRQHTLV